jgi:putative ABC transport system substrate-binding protein
MQRREFIVGLGAAITGSIQTDAQELTPVPLVGYLDDGPVEGFIFRQVEFRKGLAAADYFEGCNVAIESHRAELPDWASDLVDRGVAVLVASGSVPAILAAKAATTTIPIVFGFGADPVETGLVSSLDHPGGNITGIASMSADIGSKRLGLLRDLLPGATRVAVLVDPNEDTTVVKSMIADVRVEAMSSLVAISLRRSAMSSLVAIRLTTKSSISPSSLSVVFFGAICGEYSISVVGGTSAPIVGMSRSMKIGKRERGFWKRGSV